MADRNLALEIIRARLSHSLKTLLHFSDLKIPVGMDIMLEKGNVEYDEATQTGTFTTTFSLMTVTVPKYDLDDDDHDQGQDDDWED